MQNMKELRKLLAAGALAVENKYLESMFATIGMLESASGPMAEHILEGLKAAREVEAARRQQIAASSGGAVMVLPLYGYITPRSNWMSYYFGGTALDQFTMQFRQAVADPNITAIVIDVDSPGGSVGGVDELFAEIYAARSKKTIVAVSNTLCASAAYYIAAAATEIVVSPSSMTGSIGVFGTHVDISGWLANIGVKYTLISAGKYKVEGNEYEPLTEEAQAAEQALVDGYYNLFVKAVAKGRGVKMGDVTSGFGEGRVVLAAQAVEFKMADRIGTFDSVLAKFGVKRTGNESFYAEVTDPHPAATGIEPATPVAAAEADTAEDACGCQCAACLEGNCEGCTDEDCDDDNCPCATATAGRKATGDAHLLALQQQEVALALAL